MSKSTPKPTRPPLPLQSLTDLKATVRPPRWLWQGYLASGAVTLLTSQWKSGKTTLLAVLLAAMNKGGRCAGLKVSAGRAAVLTEESPELWLRRAEKLDFGSRMRWLCRPFAGCPTLEQWHDLIDGLAELREQKRLDLVVIDPLAAFLPGGEENHAGLMLAALSPLRRLTERGLAVLVLHHPRKGRSALGQAARGSGALMGYVDVLIEMQWYAADGADDRRRRLRAWSRYDETPRQRVIELSADGTTYRDLGDFDAAEEEGLWPVLREVLEAAPGKLTRKDVCAAWPETQAVDDKTVSRLLERAVESGRVLRDGTGHKGRPFRYWLKGKEQERGPALLPDLPPLPPLEIEEVPAERVVLNAARIILNKRRH